MRLSVRMAVQVADAWWRMSADSVGLTIPMPAFLTGRERRVRRLGGDDSGGSAAQEVGEENSVEYILHGVESGRDTVDDSLEMLPLLLVAFWRAMKAH